MNDILGRPIKVGDTILTNAYLTTAMTAVTKATKVTNKSCYHEVTIKKWDRNLGKIVQETKTFRKKYYQVLVIDAQLLQNGIDYPELQL